MAFVATVKLKFDSDRLWTRQNLTLVSNLKRFATVIKSIGTEMILKIFFLIVTNCNFIENVSIEKTKDIERVD